MRLSREFRFLIQINVLYKNEARCKYDFSVGYGLKLRIIVHKSSTSFLAHPRSLHLHQSFFNPPRPLSPVQTSLLTNSHLSTPTTTPSLHSKNLKIMSSKFHTLSSPSIEMIRHRNCPTRPLTTSNINKLLECRSSLNRWSICSCILPDCVTTSI